MSQSNSTRNVALAAAMVSLGLAACTIRPDATTQTAGLDEPPPRDARSDSAALALLADYSEWHLVNPNRFRQQERVMELCAIRPADWQTCNADAKFDMLPIGAGIHVFVNPPAEAPMLTEKRPHFPEGSIIVKQKWSGYQQVTPDLLTVMIKREAGYNPEVGNWEFLAVSGDKSHVQARGRLANCQACHIPHRENDFVVRSYLPSHILAGLQ